jgi:hypothetical protein
MMSILYGYIFSNTKDEPNQTFGSRKVLTIQSILESRTAVYCGKFVRFHTIIDMVSLNLSNFCSTIQITNRTQLNSG